jgi:hypothetical protein
MVMKRFILIFFISTQTSFLFAAMDEQERTPLHVAAFYNKVEELKALLQANDCEIDAQDIFGYSALHWAAREGHVESVQVLLKAKANRNLKTFSEDTPLSLAEEFGRLEVVCLLLGIKCPYFISSAYLFGFAAEMVYQYLYPRFLIEAVPFAVANMQEERGDYVTRLIFWTWVINVTSYFAKCLPELLSIEYFTWIKYNPFFFVSEIPNCAIDFVKSLLFKRVESRLQFEIGRRDWTWTLKMVNLIGYTANLFQILREVINNIEQEMALNT